MQSNFRLSKPMFSFCIQQLPSSETQGQLVGARGNKSGKEMKRRMFTSKAKKAPGNRLSKRFYQCCLLIGQKNPLYYSAQSANSNSRGTVVCSYTTAFASPFLLGSECEGNFHLILISPDSDEIPK